MGILGETNSGSGSEESRKSGDWRYRRGECTRGLCRSDKERLPPRRLCRCLGSLRIGSSIVGAILPSAAKPGPEQWDRARFCCAAGVPSRNNVFEYGFPEVHSPQPPIGQAPPVRRSSTQFMPPDSSTPVGGLAGQIAASPTSPAQGASPRGPLSLNEAYLEYRRRLEPSQSLASAIDNGAPAALLVPSDDANVSGDLPGRIAAMASVNPWNPIQPAPPSPVLGIFSGKPMQNYPLRRRSGFCRIIPAPTLTTTKIGICAGAGRSALIDFALAPADCETLCDVHPQTCLVIKLTSGKSPA